MIKRSLIRECLTDKEINECLARAFEALPEEEQEKIQRVMGRLTQLPLMGSKGALGLIFATERAPELARLNETLKRG